MNQRSSGVAELGRGLTMVLRGVGFLQKHPRHALLGLVPPLLVGIVVLASVVAVGVFSPTIAAWMTPFASSWDSWSRDMVRGALALALVVAYSLTMVLVFAALTLALGFPVYDKISESVDATLPAPRTEALRERPNVVADVAISVLKGVGVGLLAFFVGLIPVVGQVAGFCVGAICGGWLLSVDLLDGPMARRHITRRRSRRAIAAQRRALCLGFGIPLYLCMLVPVLSIVIFPSAVAGAVYLTRELRGEPSQ